MWVASSTVDIPRNAGCYVRERGRGLACEHWPLSWIRFSCRLAEPAAPSADRRAAARPLRWTCDYSSWLSLLPRRLMSDITTRPVR